MSTYLLLETGDKIVIEDVSGFMLLEGIVYHLDATISHAVPYIATISDAVLYTATISDASKS